jgi:hypothetical protein
MKQSEPEGKLVDDALIDRIVDGEMTAEEFRAAVLRIESDPDGWKRCALAFVEARVWSDSMRALGQTQKNDPMGLALPRSGPAAKRAGNRWLRAAAAAVVTGVSFVAGWLTHGTRVEPPPQALLVRDSDGFPFPSASEPSEVGDASTQSARAEEDRASESSEPPRIVRTVGMIRFGPESSPAEVPVLAGPGITEDWLAAQPPPVSEYGEVVLARQGYEVEQERRFFTAVLADGRRVAIPVDHVQIRYTGNEPF